MRRNGPCGLLAALLSGAGIVAAGEPITSPPKHEAAALPGLCSVAQPDCCQPDAKGPTWWFNAEYLLWRTKNHPLPVPVLSTGNLNDPDSAVLLGLGNPLNPHPRHGARFTAGLYLDCEQRLGIEGSYFFLGKRTDSREVNSSGFGDSFDTGNPFAVIDDAGVTSEAFLTLANPGLFSSSTRLDLSNFLQGYEVNGLYSLASTGNVRVSLLGGFRYVDLEEHLTLGTFSPAVPPTTTNNDFQIVDEFDARNQFYGGQLGTRFEWTAGRFFVNGTGKVAVGTMLQEINTHGFFRQTLPAVVIDSPSGLYAQPSNSGRHTRNEFAWIPEGNLNVGAKLTENVRSSVGYTFLWMSDVVRPGDQIDRVINTSQAAPVLGGNGSLVGPARPAVPFNDTTFWAQGLNIGLEIRY